MAKLYIESDECLGQHRFFALELIVEADDTIKIPLVCTQCGFLQVHSIPAKLKVVSSK